jgi:tetratricopeptide (TPR) repeat protein/tRNA A-37 threonylcarbamoyl transferase component Bud32
VDQDIAIDRRYRIEAVVARGAFGEVLRATDRGTGERVAIKRLHEHLVSADHTSRLLREASMLAAVASEHVVTCSGWGRDDAGRPCLVLEWIDGEDLGRRRSGQSVAEGIEIARQAAEGLLAIHAAGFVHGDVKPSNVLVSREGGGLKIKLIDLGVARRIGEADPALRGLIVGTPSYMSPEQARGEESITPASDLFSLGVVLYEMLAGRRPFTGSDPFVVLAKILLEDPPLLSTIAPHVPAPLDALVMRALSKPLEQRFRTAGEVIEALGRAPVSHGTMATAVDETPTVQLTPEALRPLAPQPSGMSAMSEQRVVTALFARFSPVPGAPSRARRRKAEAEAEEPLTPERAVERAMAAFETVVTQHRGVAHRTIGGRMIAVFGAVRSSGDEAERAARAALAGLSRVPAAQIAITTGRAVASLAGLSGAAIERGAGEVERAPRGVIRVDEGTARMVGAHFLVGGEENERVLLGERAASAPAPMLLGRETPLVGRERELSRLLDLYRRCVDESASRAVQVLGAPGSGKSRLRFELLRRLGSPAPTLLFGRAESLSAGSPFGLLRAALRRAAEISPTDPLPAQQKKIRAFFAQHLSGKALTRAALFLGELANVPFPDDASEGLRAARNDPMLMGDRMRAAWEDWLFAACDEAPLVIVLEDLHWGDLPSAKFVELALRLLRDRPLFVLALARPEIQEEFQGTWVGRPFDTIALGPLSAEACEKLARTALPAGTPEETVRFVADKSEGNAFYLEELVRAIAAHGASPRDGLPETVLGMVQARLDALGPEAKAVLRAASVFGIAFRSDGVRALLGDVDPGRVARLLQDLAAEEAVTPRSKDGGEAGVEHVFRNTLIRDAAYAMLTEDDRAAGHRLAAEFLTRTGGADAATLAGHHARARDTEGAARWYMKAVEEALEGNDFSAALEHAERAAQVTASPDVLGPLRALQAEAHRWRGEFDRAEARAVEAAELCAFGGAPWFRAVAEIVTAAGRRGRYEEVAAWTEKALSAEPRGGSEDAAGAKVLFLSRAAVHLGYAHREDLERRLLAGVDALLGGGGAGADPRTAARIHQIRALFGLRAGDTGRYVAEHVLALAAFEEAGDHRSACLELVSLGSGYADLGAYAQAEAALDRALASAERMGLKHIATWALQNVGHVRARLGRAAEARKCLDRALSAGDAQRDARLLGGTRIYLSQLAAEQGRFEDAEREAKQGVEVLAGAPTMRAGAQAALASALLGQGKTAEALAEARGAMATLEELGPGKMGELEALVRVVLVEALIAAGERAEATEAVRLASDRLAARAALIGDEAMRESFLTKVPEHARTRALLAQLAG